MSNQRRSRRRIRTAAPIAALPVAAIPALFASGFIAAPGSAESGVDADVPIKEACAATLLDGGRAAARFDARAETVVLEGRDGVVVTSRGCTSAATEVALVDERGLRSLGAVIPKAGEGVSASVSGGEEGVGDELHVMALDNGVVVASAETFPADLDDKLSERFPDLGWGTRPPSAALPGEEGKAAVAGVGEFDTMSGTPKCTRNDRNWNGRRESDDHTWRANHGTYPAYLDAAQTTLDLRAGPDGWEHFPRTNCLTVPLNSISHTYAGATTRMPNIAANHTCQSRDGSNVWAFQPFTASSDRVATTCSWWTSFPFLTDEITEGDVAFNTNVTWGHVVNDCTPQSRKYMISSAATHEAGHVFGFGHVAQASEQTMTPSTATCSKAWHNLGRGDMRVAQEVYPP